jgi:hypothetical protein
LICIAIHTHEYGDDAYIFKSKDKTVPSDLEVIMKFGLDFTDGIDNLDIGVLNNVKDVQVLDTIPVI